MNKLLSAFAFAILFSLGASAQTPAAEEAAQGGPEMKFETLEVDYGTIQQNSEPYRVFKFTNTGDEPLQITNAKGSCGCTVPEWPKEPVFPGEDAEIRVRYDTKRIGKFVKRVTLTANTAAETYRLTIKGEVLAPKAEPDGVPAATPSILNGKS
ncbi:MAG: DUF1573 domain-containing protein [Saprospiraceae bacterium]|nr:DUF1573 domain-containing protein [Saprospiraceae bacterium]